MKTLQIAAISFAFASCAAPKATVVAEAPEKKAEEKKVEAVAGNPMPSSPDDGLRIGDDILALPSDEQLRSSPTTSGDGDATVITRPPEE